MKVSSWAFGSKFVFFYYYTWTRGTKEPSFPAGLDTLSPWADSQCSFAVNWSCWTYLAVVGCSHTLWDLILWVDRVLSGDVNKDDLFTAERWEEELTEEQGFTAQSVRPQWLLTLQNGHILFRLTCNVPTQGLINRLVLTCMHLPLLLCLHGLGFLWFCPVFKTLKGCLKVKTSN